MAKKKDATVAQISLAWVLNQKLNVFPIVSSNNYERFKSNCQAVNIKLTQEELDWLDLASD